MAGTLTLSTLSDGTNSTSATNAIKGSAKAWVSFYGSGGATIRASYNISSVTRNSTGNYTVTLTNALVDADASVVMGDSRSGSSGNYARGSQVYMTSSSTANIFTYDSGSSIEDHLYISISIFR
jgi:hypothetical protein